MTKIEEVARAIAASCEGDGSKWGAWTHEARAAVAALRDPGDAVLTEVGAWGVCAGNIAAAWNAGIDAILKETT